jgi:hypothetical protein
MVRCRSPSRSHSCCADCFLGTKHNKRLSAFYCKCRFMRLTEVNSKTCITGDQVIYVSNRLCTNSTL